MSERVRLASGEHRARAPALLMLIRSFQTRPSGHLSAGQDLASLPSAGVGRHRAGLKEDAEGLKQHWRKKCGNKGRTAIDFKK